MKLKLAALALTIVATAGWMSACGGNARPTCLIGHYPYIVQYVPVTGDCNHIKGETVTVAKYSPPGVNPSIYLKPYSMARFGAHFDGTTASIADHALLSGGELSASEPDAENLCHIPDMVKGGSSIGTADEWSYKFSNVQFHVTALSQGGQMQADLELIQNGETCTYKAYGVTPIITCLDADDAPDDAMCDEPDVIIGWQMVPEFKSRCHAEVRDALYTGVTGTCVIDEFPSFKPGTVGQ